MTKRNHKRAKPLVASQTAARQRRPAACEILGRMRSVERLSNENLKNLHDLTFIVLVQCQGEMQRRGKKSGVQILRADI